MVESVAFPTGIGAPHECRAGRAAGFRRKRKILGTISLAVRPWLAGAKRRIDGRQLSRILTQRHQSAPGVNEPVR